MARGGVDTINEVVERIESLGGKYSTVVLLWLLRSCGGGHDRCRVVICYMVVKCVV